MSDLESQAKLLAANDPDIGEEGWDALPDQRDEHLPVSWSKQYWRHQAQRKRA